MLMFNSQLNTCVLFQQQLKAYVDCFNSQLNTCVLFQQQLKAYVDCFNSQLNTCVLFQQQLKAYVDWLNSQLKKKPGARLVEDLRNDVKDGVALVELIEVVGMYIQHVH